MRAGIGDAVTVAQDMGLGSGEALQGSQGLLGALLLDDAQHGIQDDDRHDGGSVDPFAQQGRNDRGDDEQDDDKVVQLLPEHGPEAGPPGFIQLIVTVAMQTLRGLFGGQPVIVHLQIAQDFIRRQRVPGLLCRAPHHFSSISSSDI